MGSLTDYSEKKLLDHIFNTAYTSVATVYLGLCTADPTDAATGASCNETANAGNYARTAITFGAASSRRVTQNATVTFPTASANWASPITHWVITDSGTYGAGNVLAHGAFATSKSVLNGNTPSVASGQIYVEFSAGYISNAVAHKLLDLMFRNQAYSKPNTFVALVKTTNITDSDTGSSIVEPSGGSYARVQVNPNGGGSPAWNVATGTNPTYVNNANTITFPTATADWGTIIAVAICSASTGGDLLAYDNGMTDQPVATDDVAQFAAGALEIRLS